MSRELKQYVAETKQAAFGDLFSDKKEMERYVASAMSAVYANPKIRHSDPRSVVLAVREAASLGLQIGVGNQCWLVPYKGQVQLQLGYGGVLALAFRSGQVKSVNVELVRANDVFERNEAGVRHDWDPFADPESRGRVMGAWCRVELAGGGVQWETMSTAEIESIRNRSNAVRSGKATPWDTDWGEMAKKTVLLRALKKVPKTTETTEILQRQIEQEFGFRPAKGDDPGERLLADIEQGQDDDEGDDETREESVSGVAPPSVDEPVTDDEENPFR